MLPEALGPWQLNLNPGASNKVPEQNSKLLVPSLFLSPCHRLFGALQGRRASPTSFAFVPSPLVQENTFLELAEFPRQQSGVLNSAVNRQDAEGHQRYGATPPVAVADPVLTPFAAKVSSSSASRRSNPSSSTSTARTTILSSKTSTSSDW